jgi:tripeptide aminopeptidase
MGKSIPPVDVKSAQDRLMRYLGIEGVSGQEEAIGQAIVADLKALGVPASAIGFDDAHKRIPLPTQTGNLYVRLPGTRGGKPMVFATHMDVVPLCAGAKPKVSGKKIVGDGTTALGGDNRTGCAVLVSLVETLLKNNLPHPPITLLFTVREESGLQGARFMDPKILKGASVCFNVDSRTPAVLITGAVGAERWDVEIYGKAAHAGVAPEKGISSTLVASIAIAEARRGGWFGKVVKGKQRGTSNVGIFGGKDGTVAAGNATNVVTDFVYVRGETRSPEAKFASAITAGYKAAFTKAGKQVKDDKGKTAKVKFTSRFEYPSFGIKDDAPAVRHAKRAAESMGLKPVTMFSHGGLDANWFVKYGVPTVTIGAGQYEIHTVHEYVNLPEFFDGCRLAVALATLEG